MNEVALFLNNLNFNWSIIESVAVFFSILYVILAAKENILCWGAAAISVTLYIYIFFSVQLYPETGLQVFIYLWPFMVTIIGIKKSNHYKLLSGISANILQY